MNSWSRGSNFHVRWLCKMPKNKQQKSSSQGGKSVQEVAQQNSPITTGKDGSVMIAIQAKPGAKKDAITFDGDTIGVQISAPPVDGEANTAIIKYFSDVLKVKKSDIDLKGGKSRQKTLVIPSGLITVDQCVAALTKESSKPKTKSND